MVLAALALAPHPFELRNGHLSAADIAEWKTPGLAGSRDPLAPFSLCAPAKSATKTRPLGRFAEHTRALRALVERITPPEDLARRSLLIPIETLEQRLEQYLALLRQKRARLSGDRPKNEGGRPVRDDRSTYRLATIVRYLMSQHRMARETACRRVAAAVPAACLRTSDGRHIVSDTRFKAIFPGIDRPTKSLKISGYEDDEIRPEWKAREDAVFKRLKTETAKNQAKNQRTK
jgi:hypothetical protein